MTNLSYHNSYGDDEPSKTGQPEQAKPAPTSTPAPAPAVAAAPPTAPSNENNVSTISYTQEAASVPAVAQKAVDPRAPPPPQPAAISQQTTKIGDPYAIEEEAETYTGWDAAVSGANGGAGGNDNGGYGGYGYDGSGSAGAYGDGHASGSPAIKEDGCVFILYFSCYTVCTVRIFYEARGGVRRSGLVVRNSSKGFGGKTSGCFSKGSEKVRVIRVEMKWERHYRKGKCIHPTSTTLLSRAITTISTATKISMEDLGGQESILLCHLPTATTTSTSIRELASRTALRYTGDSLCTRARDNGNQRLAWTPNTSQISTSTRNNPEIMPSTSEAASLPPSLGHHCHR